MILWEQQRAISEHLRELRAVPFHSTVAAHELRLLAAWSAFWAARRLRRENAIGMRWRATFGRRSGDHMAPAVR